MKNRIILAALVLGGSVQAAEVSLLTPISYDPILLTYRLKDSCKVDEQLTNDTAEAFRKYEVGPTVTSVDGPGERIKVTITRVDGVGGGGWTGPKEVVVRADLLKDGKVERSRKFSSASRGGVLGPFMGKCDILYRTSAAVAKDLAKWAKEGAPEPAQSAPAPQGAATAP